MNKLITVCLLLCCGMAKAQIAGYTFSKSTATLIEDSSLYIPASGLAPGLHIITVAAENGISSNKTVIN